MLREIKIKFFAAFLLSLSLAYLIYSLNFKYYWHDEVTIFSHLSGYGQEALITELYDGQTKTKEQVQKFQGVNNENGLNDTIISVAKNSPHQPPLYVSILWIWSKIFGKSDLALRSLSIVIWLGFLWVVYQLGLVLFKEKDPAIIITAMVALTNRFLGQGGDVWEYILFDFFIAASSWLFLKAFESENSLNQWIFYGIFLLGGLYTHIFFIFVAIAQLIYGVIYRHLTSKTNRIYYLSVLGCCLLLYLPWIAILNTRKTEVYPWAKVRWNTLDIVNRIISTITDLFQAYLFSSWLSLIIFNFALTLVIIAFVYLIIKSKENHNSFLILLTTVPVVSLFVYDITFGTRYSSVGRFLVPTLFGVVLSVYWVIYQGVKSQNTWIKRGSYICFIILLSLSIVSKIPYNIEKGQYQGYGSQILNSYLIINQSNNPLVIGEQWLDLFPLSYHLKDTVTYLFFNPQNFHKKAIEGNYSDIYIVNPSSSLRKALEQENLKLEPTNNETLLKIK